MRLQNKNWRHLQVFSHCYFVASNGSVQCVSIWARRHPAGNYISSCPPCARFRASSAGKPWSHPVRAEPTGGEFKCTVFCLSRRRSCIPSERSRCGSGAGRRVGPQGWLGWGCRGQRPWELPPLHHCALLMALLSSLVLACEDGYKLENETCVRYGDRSALLLPHHPS